MRYLWLLLLLPLCGFTRVHWDYDQDYKIIDEFANIENSVQDKQFRVVPSTPNLQDLQDGEIVIVSSNTFNKLMYRMNQEIYMINVSCVTVRR